MDGGMNWVDLREREYTEYTVNSPKDCIHIYGVYAKKIIQEVVKRNIFTKKVMKKAVFVPHNKKYIVYVLDDNEFPYTLVTRTSRRYVGTLNTLPTGCFYRIRRRQDNGRT
jgi:hypothetical protein